MREGSFAASMLGSYVVDVLPVSEGRKSGERDGAACVLGSNFQKWSSGRMTNGENGESAEKRSRWMVEGNNSKSRTANHFQNFRARRRSPGKRPGVILSPDRLSLLGNNAEAL